MLIKMQLYIIYGVQLTIHNGVNESMCSAVVTEMSERAACALHTVLLEGTSAERMTDC